MLSLFPFFLFFPSFSRYGYLRGSVYFNLLLFLLVNTYLSIIVAPKHAEMSFEEFTELMERINAIDIQWVVEWWRISSMAHHSLKDFAITLTTPHVALPNSLVATKGLLVIMALSMPWSSLIGL